MNGKKLIQYFKSQCGLSILEVMVSAVLLAIVGMSSAKMHVSNTKNADSQDIMFAMNFLMEQLVVRLVVNQGDFPPFMGLAYFACYTKKLRELPNRQVNAEKTSLGFGLIKSSIVEELTKNTEPRDTLTNIANRCLNKANIVAFINPKPQKYFIKIIAIQSAGQKPISALIRTFVHRF